MTPSGGSRPGAGRPQARNKRVKTSITLSPRQISFIEQNRGNNGVSETIQSMIDFYMDQKYCAKHIDKSHKKRIIRSDRAFYR